MGGYFQFLVKKQTKAFWDSYQLQPNPYQKNLPFWPHFLFRLEFNVLTFLSICNHCTFTAILRSGPANKVWFVLVHNGAQPRSVTILNWVFSNSFLTNFSCVGHPSLQAWQQHLKLYLIQDHRKWCLQRVATCIVYLRWHFHRIVCLMVVPRMNLLPIFFRAFKSRPAVHICDLLSLHLTFHFMTPKKQVHVIWSNSDEKEEPSESLRITHLLYNPSGKA